MLVNDSMNITQSMDIFIWRKINVSKPDYGVSDTDITSHNAESRACKHKSMILQGNLYYCTT